MANVIDSNLQITEILGSALEAFNRTILPLRAFSTVYSDVQLKGDDTMTIPSYPLATDASQTRAANGSYKALATGTQTDAVQITIDKNQVQGLSFNGRERARQPFLNTEKHGELKGEKLAYDVIADILSVVTVANFPNTPVTGIVPGNFDEEDLADLAQVCDEEEWPESRSLILNPALHYALVKRPALLDQSQSGDSNVLRNATIPNLMGFSTYSSNGVNAGPGNLAGMAVTGSPVLVGFSPVPPSDGVRKALVDYQIVGDAASGAVLEYKRIAYPDTDEEAQFIEAHYGYGVGDPNALKILST